VQSDKLWTAMLDEGREFLSRIVGKDRVALVFHDDCDGCCSASIFWILLDELHEGCEVKLFCTEEHDVVLTSRIVNELARFEPQHILCVDLPIDKDPESVHRTLKLTGAKMLSYDHHVPTTIIRHKSCIQINPLNIDRNMKVAPPTSCFGYRLYKYMGGGKDLCWVAGTGIVADYGTETCKEEIEEIRNHYHDLYPFEEISQSKGMQTKLMILANLINSGYQYADRKGALLAVRAIIESIDNMGPYYLLKGKSKTIQTLLLYRRKIDEEITSRVSEFREKADINWHMGLAFYMVSSEKYIVSELANRLSSLYPGLILFIISSNKQRIKFSARVGPKKGVNLDDLVKASISGIQNALGGGHRLAAGGSLPKSDLEKFIQNVTNHVRNGEKHHL